MRVLSIRDERWPIREPFVIARGAKTAAEVIVVEIDAFGHAGRGEAVPYGRYGESLDSVTAQIEQVRAAIEAGLSRAELQGVLPPGAARNAVDCALWDLAAKIAGQPVWRLAGLPEPRPVTTAYTLSLGDAAAMPVKAFLKHYWSEFEYHVEHKRCVVPAYV